MTGGHEIDRLLAALEVSDRLRLKYHAALMEIDNLLHQPQPGVLAKITDIVEKAFKPR